MASLAEVKLKKLLFKDYDNTVRPANLTTPITLKIDISLNQLIDLDERNQVLLCSLWHRLKWNDEFLKWNPSDHEGLTIFRTSSFKIWMPDLTLYNDVREEERDIAKFDAMVSNTGSVNYNYPIVMRSACRVNVRFFPFDQQVCKFKYGSWTYDGTKLDLRNSSEKGDLSNFVPHGEWDVLELLVRRHEVFYTCCPEPYPDVTFYVVMRRRPLFYLYNLVLPCIVITIITFFGFILPPTSGEKVSLGVTTLLALTVFLLLVAESMPPQSEVVPLIGQYFGCTIILLSLSTTMTVMVLYVHHKGEHKQRIPRLLRQIVFEGFARVLCMRATVVSIEKEAELIKRCHEQSNLSDSNSKLPNDTTSREVTPMSVLRSNTKIHERSPQRAPRIQPSSAQFHNHNGVPAAPLEALRSPFRPPPLVQSPFAENTSEIKELIILVRNILTKASIFENLQLEQERMEMIEAEWRLFATVIDRFLLILFGIAGMIMCFVFLMPVVDYSYDLDSVY